MSVLDVIMANLYSVYGIMEIQNLSSQRYVHAIQFFLDKSQICIRARHILNLVVTPLFRV